MEKINPLIMKGQNTLPKVPPPTKKIRHVNSWERMEYYDYELLITPAERLLLC